MVSEQIDGLTSCYGHKPKGSGKYFPLLGILELYRHPNYMRQLLSSHR